MNDLESFRNALFHLMAENNVTIGSSDYGPGGWAFVMTDGQKLTLQDMIAQGATAWHE